MISSCYTLTAATAQTRHHLGLDEAEQQSPAAQAATDAPMELARALVTELNCAVVAMRYPVTDEFRGAFTEALYSRVLRNAQPLEQAVAAAVPDAAGPAPSLARPPISVAAPVLLGSSAVKLPLTPPVSTPTVNPADAAMTQFPPEPARFVGRCKVMAAASAALAPASGRTAVLFQGMAGVGTTTCAVELAYRHQRAFATSVFWSAPADPHQFGDALRLLALTLDAQLGRHGVAMVDKITTPENLENFLPTLTAALADTPLLLVLDNLDTVLTTEGQWRDLRWAPLIGALTSRA